MPTTSIGASAAAIMRHLAGVKPELATIFTAREPGRVEPLAHMPDRRGGDAGADEVAQLLLGAIAADRLGRVASSTA